MNSSNSLFTLIIDIGKTHVKLHVLDKHYQSAFSKQMTNTVDTDGIYPSASVEKIWSWLTQTIKLVSAKFNISRMTITTHGATAALIDRNANMADHLVLPVLDYEYATIFEDCPEYEELRPSFDSTCSPSLPAGLNLGRQLYWLKKKYPERFDKTSDILMYPQYWAWRFTGTRVSEITSLGCHTDLWSIKDNTYSSLINKLDCHNLLPPVEPAWFNCGKIHPSLCESLGLDPHCEFHSGLHDSNASFLRYRLSQNAAPFTVISTGTWTILMASQASLQKLEPSKDMLANVDALGTPIACARFMGGREFETICEQAGSWLGEQFDETDLQLIINMKTYALPDFSEGSGPFGGKESEFIGPVDKVSGIALATIYCALMIDYQLTMLDVSGDIIIEGAFLKNPLLCAIVSQLRQGQQVRLSQDATGTVLGAAYLTNWGNVNAEIEMKPVKSTTLQGLLNYKEQWLELTDTDVTKKHY